MSGSYDRPPGRQRAVYEPSLQRRPTEQTEQTESFESYADPVTGPPTGRHMDFDRGLAEPERGYQPMTAPEPARRREIGPELRPPEPDPGEFDHRGGKRRKGRKAKTGAAIVPAGSVTGRSLTMVIAIMCFLACLTAGAVYIMNQSASAWLSDIASEVTVQVEPRENTDTEKTVRDVTQFLTRQPGIANVRPLSLEASAKLVEPWLGQVEALKTLPVPRLIALEIDRTQPADLETIRLLLDKQFKGTTLDDHRQWQRQIRTVTRSFALGGLAILMLVGAATTAIIVSATRSAMASNREIVEVLHFVGATDRFIAGEFQKHFLRLGVKSGLVGALSAMFVFATMPTIMELLGGGSVTVAEIRRLVGTGALDGPGYALLALVVVVIAALCMITSRLGVFRILHSRQ